LAKLANVTALPAQNPDFDLSEFGTLSDNPADTHQLAKQLLDRGQVEAAWQVLLK
jgi:hypothetical protein